MTIYTSKTYTPAEAAFMAGCIDCDGSISVEVGKGKVTKINITSIDKWFLEEIKRMANCGHIYIVHKERISLGYKSKIGYEWHLSAKRYLYPFLTQILPYLILKKEKAKQAILCLEKRNQYGGGFIFPISGIFSE